MLPRPCVGRSPAPFLVHRMAVATRVSRFLDLEQFLTPLYLLCARAASKQLMTFSWAFRFTRGIAAESPLPPNPVVSSPLAWVQTEFKIHDLHGASHMPCFSRLDLCGFGSHVERSSMRSQSFLTPKGACRPPCVAQQPEMFHGFHVRNRSNRIIAESVIRGAQIKQIRHDESAS